MPKKSNEMIIIKIISLLNLSFLLFGFNKKCITIADIAKMAK